MKISPKKQIGIVATIIFNKRINSSFFNSKLKNWINPLNKIIVSLLKKIINAKRLPRWTDMSINTPWSEVFIRYGRIIKWAEEEIGKNSVIPWIMAIKKIWKENIIYVTILAM